MYVATIIICNQKKIKFVADGARKSQSFAIEQDILIKQFESFFKQYSIKIEYPLLNTISDFDIKNEILARGFVPKTLESQCLLGIPIGEQNLSEEVIFSISKVFDLYIKQKAQDIIIKYKELKFN